MSFDLNHIGFTEDCSPSWRFFVDEPFISGLSDRNDTLLGKVASFYSDYLAISQKYQIGEILPLKNSDMNGDELVRLVSLLSKEFVTNRKAFSFFPLFNVRRDTSNKEYTRLLPCACEFLLVDKDGKTCLDYFFINKTGVTDLNDYDLKNLPGGADSFSIIGHGDSLSRMESVDPEDVGFSIELCSEIWFDRTQRFVSGHGGNGVDNKFLAYHNTPRFNSYLRELTKIWVEKYGWHMEMEDGWYGTNSKGIPLDGEVVFFEDVESGRVKIPNLSG